MAPSNAPICSSSAGSACPVVGAALAVLAAMVLPRSFMPAGARSVRALMPLSNSCTRLRLRLGGSLTRAAHGLRSTGSGYLGLLDALLPLGQALYLCLICRGYGRSAVLRQSAQRQQ